MAQLWRKTAPGQEKSPVTAVDTAGGVTLARPTIVYLCGLFATDKTPWLLSASIDRIEEFMEQLPDARDADIFVWSHTPGLMSAFRVAAQSYRADTAYSKENEALARAVILPLVADNIRRDGGKLQADLPAEDIVRARLRQLTFVGYSGGTVTAQGAFNAAVDMMEEIGYARAAAHELLGEVVLFSVGHVTKPQREANRFTTVYLRAKNDLACWLHSMVGHPVMTFARALKAKSLRLLGRVFNKRPRAATTKLTPRQIELTDALPARDHEERQRSGRKWKEKIRRTLPKYIPLDLRHEFSRYFSTDKNISPYVDRLRHAFMTAVGRTRTLKADDLILPPPASPTGAAPVSP